MEQYPDLSRLMQLLRSPAGQQLWQLLNRSDPETLKKAADHARSGNTQQAKQALGSLSEDPQIQKLLRQLEEQL